MAPALVTKREFLAFMKEVKKFKRDFDKLERNLQKKFPAKPAKKKSKAKKD